MRKRTYEKPQFCVSRFTPNEFCAACSTHYKFSCSAGKTDIFGNNAQYNIYYDTGSKPGEWDRGDELISKSYRKCGYPKTETGQDYLEVPVGELKDGIITRSFIFESLVFEQIPVLIYVGTDTTKDIHAAAKADIQTTRS